MSKHVSKNIRRKIVKVETTVFGQGGDTTLHLECGHVSCRKKSQGVPKSMMCRCLDCEHLRGGGSSRRGNVVQSWDMTSQWPVYKRVGE